MMQDHDDAGAKRNDPNHPKSPVPDKIVIRVSDRVAVHHGVIDDIARKLGFTAHRLGGLKDLVGFLCYSDRAPDLICLDHLMLADLDVEKTVLTLQTLMKIRFGDSPYKIAIRTEIPVERSWIKTYKNLGVSGLIATTCGFNYHLNVKCYQEILFGEGEYWPREAIITTPGPSKIRQADDCGINLTERQQQVKRLLCERGLSNKAIARQLNISESTVKIHVSAILKRYAVRNRTQLALAVKNSARL